VKRFIRIAACIICAALVSLGGIRARAQQSTGHYFPQTGHNITGEFWRFYQSIPGADVIFGMPITEQFTSADGSGLTVQYFEKSRFELHEDQPEGKRVQLSAVGIRLYKPGEPSINLTTPGACKTLNSFGVCYDFLTFFDEHGGLDRFGYPLSGFVFQPDGRLVQYFERARFEWHPELEAGMNVRLSDYGRIYADKYEDTARFNAALPLDNIPLPSSRPLSLKVSAFTARPVTLPSDTQKVFVIVQDQALAPVAGATGSVKIHLTSGEILTYPVVTNENGLGVVPSMKFEDQFPGSQIILEVNMSFQGMAASTSTSFLVWR
jgi:hypothetical protein